MLDLDRGVVGEHLEQRQLAILVEVALADEGGDVLLRLLLLRERIVLLDLRVQAAHDTPELIVSGPAVHLGHAARDLRRSYIIEEYDRKDDINNQEKRSA